jgi:small basic protein
MNKQQKTDLVFIIFSCIPTVLAMVSMLIAFIIPSTIFGTGTKPGVSMLAILFLSLAVFGIFDIIFSLGHIVGNKPVQYEKETQYNRYVLLLGFLNIILLLVLLLFLGGMIGTPV